MLEKSPPRKRGRSLQQVMPDNTIFPFAGPRPRFQDELKSLSAPRPANLGLAFLTAAARASQASWGYFCLWVVVITSFHSMRFDTVTEKE